MERFDFGGSTIDGFVMDFVSSDDDSVESVGDDPHFVAGLELGEELRDACPTTRCPQTTGVVMRVTGAIAVSMRCANFGSSSCLLTEKDPLEVGKSIDQRSSDLGYTE